MARPLEGIRVLEWGSAHAGPGAGYMLGDLGADVIKVESRVHLEYLRKMPTVWAGKWARSGPFNWVVDVTNRSKRGIVLELNHPKAREIFHKLVATSDIFLTNYKSDVLARNEADYETLSKYNPKLVYLSTSGSGLRGPHPEMRAFDTTAQGLAGWMFQAGDRDQNKDEPVYTVMGVLDQIAATVVAYALMAGLVVRDRTGKGVRLETSLLGANVHAQVMNIASAAWEGKAAGRHARDRAPNALGNHYRCADGKWLMLTELDSVRFWSVFCQAIGKPEMATDPKFESAKARLENRRELIRILDELFIAKPLEEWIKILEEKGGGLAFSWINTINDVLTDEQILANDYVVDFDFGKYGHNKAVGCPIRFFGYETGPTSRGPDLGEHNHEVLAELGLSPEEIKELEKEKII